jgi:hypothetical protein
MYELSRVRLRGVGPIAARYEDVTLDLSGVGQPVGEARQDMFWSSEPQRRPSPASLLFLENGGGKSVLLRLIFSVVLPGRRNVVGTKDTRALDSFVQGTDVAHVVLEWTHAGTGRRLVTGKVSQWRNDRVSSNADDLSERWYHFHPGPGMDLDALPFERDGKYLTQAEFCDELRRAQLEHPALGYRLCQVQSEWTERLGDLGIDPELFRYQRAMNNDEGEAADAFSFATDAAFVSFLLSAVLPGEDARNLVDVLGTYAEKLAQRGDMELEKTFLEGALERLAPLAAAHGDRLTAEDRQAGAHVARDHFVRRIRARAEQEQAVLAQHDAAVAQLRDEKRRVGDAHQRSVLVVQELRRRLAELRLAEATARHAAARTEGQDAERIVKGWSAVPAVLRHLEAVSSHTRLRALVDATEKAAQPALEARDTAAGALAQALAAMIRSLREQADTAQQTAAEQDGRATEAQGAHDAAVGEAARHEAEARARDERVSEVRGEIAHAVRDGLVPDGMAVIDAHTLAVSEADANRDRLATAEATAEKLTRDHQLATDRHLAAQQALSAAEHAFDTARRAHRAADGTMRALAEELRAAGLYSGEIGDLDAEAASLVDQLTRAHDHAEAARLDVRVAVAGDERALTALETTERLPPSVEAARVCELLNAAHVPCTTGWEYLASIPDVGRRAELVAKVPQLASGVLFKTPEDADRADELLRDAEVSTQDFIALDTISALIGKDSAPPGARHVVPAHPALYDEQAGQAERLTLSQRRDEHLHRLAELDETIRVHAAFRARLVQWRADCPPGRLPALAETMALREEEARTAQEAATAATAERDALAATLAEARADLPPLRKAQTGLDRRVEALKALLEREARIPSWLEEAQRAREASQQQRAAADTARTAAEAARAAAADARRTADGLRATADRTGEELAELPVQDAAETTGQAAGPLPVLRHAYRRAAEEYARVAVGDDLLTDLRQAEGEAEAAARALASWTDAEQATARELLNGPDGADVAARSAGKNRAEIRARQLRESVDEAHFEVLRCRSALKEFGPPPADVPGLAVKQPRDVPDGERLVAAAVRTRDDAERSAADLGRHLEEAAQAQEAARQTTTAFKHLVSAIGIPSDDRPEAANAAGEPPLVVTPFEDSVTAARERYDVLNSEHRAARRRATDAAEAERTLTDDLVAHANSFQKLSSPSRQVIATAERGGIPARAAEWADDLRPRLRTLVLDLDSIGRHRQQIVNQFTQQVQEALRTLRRAQRFSTLPEGLGNWSGQEFLRIRFTEPTEEALRDRLGQVVDEAAAGIQTGPTKRDPRQLILKGVEAAVVPKGFRVTILKPDAALEVQRVRVGNIRGVFSGGQILTAAIVLYCTMAALRANERGRLGNRHSGVLFLDNPIGRASALYLLRLQQSVARALGVQLVYTTGLYDQAAVDVFPLIIRLRNDADLRAGRRYLSVAERFTAALDGSLRNVVRGDKPPGDLTAVRYYTRPAAEETS